MTILSIADSEFLPRLETLAGSIARNAPWARLHAYLVNVQADLGDRLRRIHSPTDLTYVEEELDSTVVKMGMDWATRYTEKAGFCVNLRGRAMLSLLREGRERVLFVDADTIVRGDLAPLLSLIDAHDLVIHMRPKEKDYKRVAGGVIGIRPTPAGLELAERVATHIAAFGDRDYFSDQRAVHQAMQEMGDRLRVAHLPAAFIDWKFDDSSAIWVGKGTTKFSEKYLAEERRYAPHFP